jgi:SAM-dependent methyltransferase
VPRVRRGERGRWRRWRDLAVQRIAPRLPRRPAPLALPADVADADAVAAFLAEADPFGDQRDEANCYLGNALERFRTTMAVLPAVARGAPVLELGANPYHMTRLLRRRGLDVTCANWFGPGNADHADHGVQELVNRRTGEVEPVAYDHFNVESDRFPYDDGRFALVLCCEILEHLPNDPVRMLAEVHRVLAPGGALVLTTPNAARAENVARILRGDNVYEHLSGHGAYGRHNREYTRAELADLLGALGSWSSTCPSTTPTPGRRGGSRCRRAPCGPTAATRCSPAPAPRARSAGATRRGCTRAGTRSCGWSGPTSSSA